MNINSNTQRAIWWSLLWVIAPILAFSVGTSRAVVESVREQITRWRVLEVLRDESPDHAPPRVDSSISFSVVLALRASECLMCNAEISAFADNARLLKIGELVVLLTGRDSALRQKVMEQSEPGVTFVRLSRAQEAHIAQFARLPMRLLLRKGRVVMVRSGDRVASEFWDEARSLVSGRVR